MADAPVSVFISYSRTDSPFIDRLEADLRAYGFTTWVDRQHLEGGADWARLIEQQILSHEAFVVALSPDAIVSNWVRNELTFALNIGRRVVPIIVRPVERAPIEIINLQYIDLSTTYADHLQELRIVLLKTRDLLPPPTPVQTPPSLLSPDLSDPLKGLVDIPAAPPPPNPDLNAIFMQAQSALAHSSLDLAEALLRQVVERDQHFGNELAAEDLERVRRQLEPIQIERLRRMAGETHAHGAWGEEIGALRALASRLPNEDAIRDQLEIAEECQKWAWLYVNARAFAQSNDIAATSAALARLWEKVPQYGDPAHIAPPGLQPPAPSGTPTAQRYATLPPGSVIATFDAHDGPISALRWSPNGMRLATARGPSYGGAPGWGAPPAGPTPAANAVLRIWNPRDGKSILDYERQTLAIKQMRDIAWMADGHALVSTDGSVVHLLRATEERVIFTLRPDGQVTDVHATGEDNETFEAVGVAAARGYGHLDLNVYTWSGKTGGQIGKKTGDAGGGANTYGGCHWSPNGAWIAMWTENFVDVRAADTLTRVAIYQAYGYISVGIAASINYLAWGPDSAHIVLGCRDASVRILRLSSGDRATPSTKDPAQPAAPTWNPFRRAVAPPQQAASTQSQPEPVPSMTVTLTCGGHAGPVTVVAWSPDGRRLASASSDGVRIWDSADGRLLHTYPGHQAGVGALAFSPDSFRIASGDASGQVHIWKA